MLAFDALMAATPATTAGVRAVIAYLERQDAIRLDVVDVLAMWSRSVAAE